MTQSGRAGFVEERITDGPLIDETSGTLSFRPDCARFHPMKILTALAVLLFSTGGSLTAAPVSDADRQEIVAAANAYVRAQAAVTSARVEVEAVESGYARARLTAAGTDPATIFLKKVKGVWRGLTLGTDFAANDYDRLGIPARLRVP